MKIKKPKNYKETIEDLEGILRKPANYTYYEIQNYDDEHKSLVVPFSDVHVGNIDWKQKEFEKNIEWCFDEKNVVLLLNGDLIEAKTRSRKGEGIFSQWNPQQQIEYILKMLKPFADEKKIIAITNGNHEDAITLETGVDITSIFAKELNVPYLKNGGFISIKLLNQLYQFYMTHGSSGATLPYTKSKAVRDLTNFITGVDCFIYGHVHAKEHATQQVYYPDTRGRQIKTKDIHYVLSGHYLNYFNSYAQQKSMRPSATGTPKIKLSGDEKLIKVIL